MQLKRRSLYRTPHGHYFMYSGVHHRSVFGERLVFLPVRGNGSIHLSVNELHRPGPWLRSLKLVGNNYASKVS